MYATMGVYLCVSGPIPGRDTINSGVPSVCHNDSYLGPYMTFLHVGDTRIENKPGI